jgi:gliding motility-associated-like protein
VGTIDCFAEDSIPVWFRGGTKPELGPDTAICVDDGGVYRLSVPGFLLYRWSYAGEADVNLRAEFGPTIFARSLGRYSVETLDSTGCLARDSVALRDGCQRKLLPNAFSPNADGLNDRFTTRLTNLLDMQLSIFDRWGRLVFQTRNPEEHWDGTENAKPCPEGVYVWQLGYRRTSTEALRQESGTVTLIR